MRLQRMIDEEAERLREEQQCEKPTMWDNQRLKQQEKELRLQRPATRACMRRVHHFDGPGLRAREVSSLRRCVAIAKRPDAPNMMVAHSAQQRIQALQLADGEGLQLTGDEEIGFLEARCDVGINVYQPDGVLVRRSNSLDTTTTVSVVSQPGVDSVYSVVTNFNAWMLALQNTKAKRRPNGSFRRDKQGEIQYTQPE